jgi:hypothetical protein
MQNPMDPNFDPTPIYIGENKRKQSASIDMTRDQELAIKQMKKINTPSFTTSEDPIHKRRTSDLLLKHGEPSLIGPLKDLTEQEIVLPNEIELFSHYDGSMTNSPMMKGSKGKIVDKSMQQDLMRLSMARISLNEVRMSKFGNNVRKSITKASLDQNPLGRTSSGPPQELGFF